MKALKTGSDSFFTETGDSSTLADGAAGIALSRAVCDGLMDEQLRQSDLNRAIGRIQRYIDETGNSFLAEDASIGSGMASIAYTAALMPRSIVDSRLSSIADRISKRLIQQRRELGYYKSGLKCIDNGEDISFSTGSIGVGYAMLVQSSEVKSAGIFSLENECREVQYARPEIWVLDSSPFILALKSCFPKTVACFGDERLGDCCARGQSKIIHLPKWIDHIVSQHQKIEVRQELLKEIYRIERSRYDFDFSMKGDRFIALEYDNRCSEGAALLELLDDCKLLKKKLTLSESISMLKSSKQVELIDGDLVEQFSDAPVYYLQRSRAYGVSEFVLPQFNYIMLSQFRKRTKLKTALRRMLDNIVLKDTQDRENVMLIAIEQVKEALKTGLLYVS